ncbi:MAG: hypothetical protein CVU13_11675 [Bacteroidetes bacterium HGW-Bacteroidetes-8]|jgi:hypothetical protein|nr:MAG: hypothetical protein CVU13_11675 [Bacteroidetes bacterium HGW-Bacteroidetes-8]
MKKSFGITALILVLGLLLSCGITRRGYNETTTGMLSIKDTVSVNDSTEYELLVFDPGFDYWLASKSFNKNMYSNEHLQMLNQQYSLEWNRRYSSGERLVESYIDYNPLIKYDFEFNYKLYMYFLYFEESNKMSLIPGARRRHY